MGAYLGKVYLASSFALIPRVIELANILESHGHRITIKWWEKSKLNVHDEHDTWSPEKYFTDPETVENCRKVFERDFNGVEQCDLFILVAGNTPQKFNGANIELGIALALGKTCMAIGNLENCALYYPVFKYKDIRGLINGIRQVTFLDEDFDDYSPNDFDPSPDCIESDTYYDDEDRDIEKRG
jgi:nucleoside 2-deoxyribosyltransferase